MNPAAVIAQRASRPTDGQQRRDCLAARRTLRPIAKDDDHPVTKLVTPLDDLGSWDVDGARNRAAAEVAAQADIDEQRSCARVLAQLEFPHSLDTRVKLQGLDHPPSRVNLEQPDLTSDSSRNPHRHRPTLHAIQSTVHSPTVASTQLFACGIRVTGAPAGGESECS